MQPPAKPWETTSLQNSRQMSKSPSISQNSISRSIPVLPPRPQTSVSTYNSPYSPYSNYSAGYGGMGYGAYASPYRSSMYGNYGSYGGYGMYGMNGPYNGGYNNPDDTERRFIQYVEDRSRNTFSNIENVVRAVNSLSMMLDNTFFAITSSFRAVLSVAENFGRLRNVFGHIWYSLNIFRLFSWFYRKILYLSGRRAPGSSLAWKEATGGSVHVDGKSSVSTLAFLGLLFSAPYLISKLLPKYEDKSNPENWKTPGIKAKAAFDFRATSPEELSFDLNDEITLAPTYVQEEMKLTNTGWAFANCKGRSGYVPVNYLMLSSPNNNNTGEVLVPRKPLKSSLKRVSFGENQIFPPSEPSYENEMKEEVAVKKDGDKTEVKQDKIVDEVEK